MPAIDRRVLDASAQWIDVRSTGCREKEREVTAMGRKRVRGKLLRRFPYIIIYAIEPNQVRILAVAHQSRRPSYWVDRL